uniref:Uncharacterized protein n=1 Tax=Anguilla anguilla TaxID=7936 RepID=A0A0E9V3U3_ANGAN
MTLQTKWGLPVCLTLNALEIVCGSNTQPTQMFLDAVLGIPFIKTPEMKLLQKGADLRDTLQ